MSLLSAAKSSFCFKDNILIYLTISKLFFVYLILQSTTLPATYRKEDKDNFTDNPRYNRFLVRDSTWKVTETERGIILFSPQIACFQRI